MSRNGSGVYSLPAGNPVVTGTTISSSWANTTLSDIATALTGSVAADGQTAMTGNLQMGNNKITGLAVATSSGDALSYGQAATISALTVSGAFAANGGATLGDASGDALTINSSAVSIPNGLNFDSNTLVIDATNNNVGIGTSSPTGGFKLDIQSANAQVRTESTTGTNDVQHRLINTGGTFRFAIDSSTGAIFGAAYAAAVWYSGNYPMLFATNNTERMRIDSSGNVGIGTSSPSAKLHVKGAYTGGTILADTADRYSGITFQNNGSTKLQMYYDNTNVGADYYMGAGTGYQRWYTDATERMRIDSSGNLLVGKTALTDTGAGFALAGTGSGVTGLSYFARDSGLVMSLSRTTTTGDILRLVYNGSQVGAISTNGSTTTYGTSSDYRLKDITGDLTGYKERIMALQPKQGSWKVDGSVFKGFVAHEFAEQYPNAVSGEKDAVDAEGKPMYQGMQAGGAETIADLVALAKEQQAIITDLKARLEVLESK